MIHFDGIQRAYAVALVDAKLQFTFDFHNTASLLHIIKLYMRNVKHQMWNFRIFYPYPTHCIIKEGVGTMNYNFIDSYIKLGLNIQYQRKLKNLTQEELAEKINLQRSHMGKIEGARAAPSIDVIFAIADALDIPASRLFEFRD